MTTEDISQRIDAWLAGPRSPWIVDGMEIAFAAEFQGSVSVAVPMTIPDGGIGGLRARWPQASWITAREGRDLVIAFVRCAPTAPAILEALHLGRRILASTTTRPDLN